MEYFFYINNDSLTCRNYRNGYTGNVNTYCAHFDIHSDIEGLTWFCVFKQNNVAYQCIIENNTCFFPSEILQNKGIVEIGCYAVPFGEEDYKRISTNWVNVSISEGAYSEATSPEIPKPDVWETLVSRSIPIIGDNGNWYIWDYEASKYIDSGMSAVNEGGMTPEDKVAINEYIDEQTEIIKSDVEGLQKQVKEHAHFIGYLSTNAKIQSLEATPNDFAYSAESGTVWVYDAENGWHDTETPVPDKSTPASNATPLMNGEASHGQSEEYARADHRHPTDTTRVGVSEFNNWKKPIENALDNTIVPLLSNAPKADKIYSYTISESTDFVLPTVTDGKFHQILILATIENTPAITYGTDYYFNGTVPTADNGECDIIFEFDGMKWTAGVISKGSGA